MVGREYRDDLPWRIDPHEGARTTGFAISERLTDTGDGDELRYELKKVWRDGTRFVKLDPYELLARICAMVPPPWFNMVRFHGLLAPSQWACFEPADSLHADLKKRLISHSFRTSLAWSHCFPYQRGQRGIILCKPQHPNHCSPIPKKLGQTEQALASQSPPWRR